jgi:hypothetical protein
MHVFYIEYNLFLLLLMLQQKSKSVSLRIGNIGLQEL